MNFNQAEVVSYLKFKKRERVKTLKEVSEIIQEIFESLATTTSFFVPDDLNNLQARLKKTIGSTIENELIFHAHSNVLLILQYLDQHGDLKGNIPELENRIALDAVALFERSMFESKDLIKDQVKGQAASIVIPLVCAHLM